MSAFGGTVVLESANDSAVSRCMPHSTLTFRMLLEKNVRADVLVRTN
jgi:hypothetical protein